MLVGGGDTVPELLPPAPSDVEAASPLPDPLPPLPLPPPAAESSAPPSAPVEPFTVAVLPEHPLPPRPSIGASSGSAATSTVLPNAIDLTLASQPRRRHRADASSASLQRSSAVVHLAERRNDARQGSRRVWGSRGRTSRADRPQPACRVVVEIVGHRWRWRATAGR